MDLNLDRLGEMHPLLSKTTVRDFGRKAAIGLQRHGHLSGVSATLTIDGNRRSGMLFWPDTNAEDRELFDVHRITEEGAEAIALVLAYVAKGWVVRRRLQRGEFADWLLLDGDRRLVAMEISGIDAEDRGGRRLREKIGQVGKSAVAQLKAACVAEFRPPRVTLATV